jgi:hypothetical protein
VTTPSPLQRASRTSRASSATTRSIPPPNPSHPPPPQLERRLNDLLRTALLTSALDALLLVGVSRDAVDVFERYVDATADVQTPALVLSLGGAKLAQEERVARWIAELFLIKCRQYVRRYRDLLDRWRLYNARIKFDVQFATCTGIKPQVWQGAVVAAESTQTQVWARCNFCQDSLQLGSRPARATTRLVGLRTMANTVSAAAPKVAC